MSFPTKKELSRVRNRLSKIKPTLLISKNASATDRLKYEICRQFVKYLRTNDIDQSKLAEIVHVDPARISEIVRYKIDLFTVDRLLGLLERLRPNVKVKVA